MNWWKRLEGRVRVDEPLSRHTTWRIGGPADFFIEPRDMQDLKLLISVAKGYKIPILVIGAGSNILAGDKRLRRIIISLSSPFFKKITFKGNLAQAGSGLTLARLVSETAKRGLSGAEFLSGIPGTLGGALSMNAGAWGSQISKAVIQASVMDINAKIKILAKERIDFAYRKSNLGKFIILGATLKFSRKDKRKIRQDIQRYRRQRSILEDRSFPSAGSVFKNPPGEYAGRLIDLCGLKGTTSGGACISLKHANFILNRNNAQAADILRLMALIKKEVKNNFKINLQPEIKIWQ
ncbi:MAG: UDP-N-acetylmuramate dehydrogenase [Candidatus Omnitrophota bacterium]|nr:UDP-N-acetylmuramate dehydrogenase [Candidatus Omnitrophota bacterium]